jgi:hypothetical protein
MCRNIKPLYNFEPPATLDDIRQASLQFVRKVTGFTAPTAINQGSFNSAVDEISAICARLFGELETSAPAKDWAVEEARRRARAADRYPAPR